MPDAISAFEAASLEQRRAPSWRLWVGLTVLLSGSFMSVMDVFVVNVAIPSIRRDLGASFAEIELVVAAYGLAYAILLITGGRLGDLYGRRRMFMTGLLSFTVASGLCGLAPTATLLVAARALQGLAAAIMTPQVLSLIRVTFTDPRRRATAFSIMGVAFGLGCIAGQLFGGIIVEHDFLGLGWRPVFLINIPIGLAGFLAAPWLIDESRSARAARLDVAGVTLSALGLGLVLEPLVQGREAGWPASAFLTMAAGVPVLLGFAVHQHRKSRNARSPLLETSLFRERGFALGVVIALVFFSTINAYYLSFALLVQIGLGHSPLQAGLILTGNAVSFMAASLAAGRFPRHWGRATLIAGAVIATIASLLATATAAWVEPLNGQHFVPILLLWGIGQGLLVTLLFNVILGGVGEHHAGAAAGVLSTMQQVGGAFGVAVVGLLFAWVLDGAHGLGLPDAAAYADAFMAASLYGAAGAALTAALLLRLPRPRQAVVR